MKNVSADTNLSIINLPEVVQHIFDSAQRPLLSDAQGPLGLFVRYLRRKPARGLAVIYSVDELQSAHKKHTHDPHRSVSLTLDEQALEGTRIRFSLVQTYQAEVEVQPSGVLQSPELGLSVQAFPADNGLPNLAQSSDTTPSSEVFQALEKAAQALLQEAHWQLAAAFSEPVRYKPSNRCVIRYHLLLARPQDESQDVEQATLRPLTIFGKVYSNMGQAQTVQRLQQQLYDEQRQSDMSPLLPRPLGTIEHLGLTFNEAVQPPSRRFNVTEDAWATLRTGTKALQPKVQFSKGGVVTRTILPAEELRLTAQALVRLHNSKVTPDEKAPRTGAKEAKRARERAALIAAHTPEKAEEVQQLAGQLAERLSSIQPEAYRPAHGGFKASQLLFHSHRVFVVDFDGFCLADPALDVGYFLAYLRPSGLWYNNQGMRQWFEESATIFRTTYHEAMLAAGITEETVTNILQRARLYEAALIFKIATRRANRLNSSRPRELGVMLQEISDCCGSVLSSPLSGSGFK